jgi:hypothetical protein
MDPAEPVRVIGVDAVTTKGEIGFDCAGMAPAMAARLINMRALLDII